MREINYKGQKMQLRNNLFRFNKPDNFQDIPTSKLMKDLVYDFNDPYIPFFTPIGTKLFNNIENVFKQNASTIDCDEVIIPQLMTTELLAQGQEIGELFGRKIMHLSGKMTDYHLITSPEMLFINTLRRNNIDANSLPINYYYISNLFRDMPDPKNILRSKQFRVIGGISLDRSHQDRLKTENKLLEILHKTFNDCKIPFLAEYGSSGFTCEYFYMNSKETENYVIRSIDPHKKTKALSFAMIYDYTKECPFDIMHINPLTCTKNKTFITSYAISTQRLLYVIMDNSKDIKGFALPAKLRPYDVAIITNENGLETAKNMMLDMSDHGISAYIDNMFGKTHIKRLDNADYIGTGLKVVDRNNIFSTFDRNGTLVAKCSSPDDVIATVRQFIATEKQK